MTKKIQKELLKYKIAIFGLGYVGLPLAVELGKKFDTIGFDINYERIMNLNKGIDDTKEFSKKYIKSSKNLVVDSINFFIGPKISFAHIFYNCIWQSRV